MLRRAEHLRGRARLDHLAVREHDDVIERTWQKGQVIVDGAVGAAELGGIFARSGEGCRLGG